MESEKCKCGNVVEGSFKPTDTRRYLTGIAKKGGMKALLGVAGSVIPGFGNIAGFLTGTAIDLIYGKDIDKFIDKIADQFEDKKVYVFTCPNCGRSWTRALDVEGEEETSSEQTYEEYVAEPFEVAKRYGVLTPGFRRGALEGITRYLIGLNLLEEKFDELDGSNSEDLSDYQKIGDTIDEEVQDLIGYIAHQCVGTTSATRVYSQKINSPFIMDVKGVYPISRPDKEYKQAFLIGTIRSGRVQNNQRIKLPNDIITEVKGVVMFGKILDEAEAGDICGLIVPVPYFNEDESWFNEDLKLDADFTIMNATPDAPKADTVLTDEEVEYLTEFKACLGEKGELSDSERRLLDRLAKSSGISKERMAEIEYMCCSDSLSPEEEEYAGELKECLRNGGEISDSERRLLNRLRNSLGISEERAREIERKLQ